MAVTPAPIALVTGQPAKLNPVALTAAADLVFTIQPDPSGNDFSGIFQVVGTITTLTSSLQISLDGGTTFVDLIASSAFLSSTGPVTIKLQTPLIAGALYRIHATVLTGSQDFWVCTN